MFYRILSLTSLILLSVLSASSAPLAAGSDNSAGVIVSPRVNQEIDPELLKSHKEALILEKQRIKERKELQRKKLNEIKKQRRAQKMKKRSQERARKRLEKEANRAKKRAEREARKLQKTKERAEREALKLTKEKERLAATAQALEPVQLGSDENKELDDFDKKRLELKENEKEALDFVFPSISQEEEQILAEEEFFTKTERDQLLELWRSTIARNRTIQFIIKALSPSSDQLKKNNAVVQTLSKAIFVPFYAMSAVADSSLINSGSLVGARVLGDVVESVDKQRSRTKEITHTELVVMFMLVDEVAERLRDAYREYKLVKIEKDLLGYELKEAQFDASEALNLEDSGSEVARFFTRKVVRNVQRESRRLDHIQRRKRSTLVELAGTEAVASVDILIDLEVETLVGNLTNI